jgi:flagellar biosynthesis protein FliP
LVAGFLTTFAFFGAAAFLSATLVLVTRPVLVFLSSVGTSTTAGACSRDSQRGSNHATFAIHTSAGAFAVAVFLALGLAVLALVFVAVFFGAAFFAVVVLVLVAAFLGAAFVAVGAVVFGLASLASFCVMSAKYSPLWNKYSEPLEQQPLVRRQA